MGETEDISFGSTEAVDEVIEEYADYAAEVEFCPCCGTAIGIKGDYELRFDEKGWIQLPLWNQSKLDQP